MQAVMQAVNESKAELSVEEIDVFCITALERAKDADHERTRVPLVGFVFNLLDSASTDMRNNFLDHMVEYMLQPHENRRKLGAEYYRSAKHLAASAVRLAGIKSLISKLVSDGSNLSEETRPILDVITEEFEVLKTDEDMLHNLLRTAATDAKADESRIIALEYIRRLGTLKSLPAELEESLYNAERSAKERVSSAALAAIRELKLRKIPNDVKSKLEASEKPE
jgi:hypothetical protein